MVLTEVKERIGYIILNRLDKKNALNYEYIQALKDNLSAFSERKDVKIVVIKSNSDVFCAGADLSYLLSLKDNSLEDNVADSKHIGDLFDMIYNFPKLTISQVEGHAIAGGCGIATATDFCFATTNAKLGYSEVKIGFIPALVSIYLLRKIGETKTKELLLTGKLVSGDEALRIGLVNEIIEESEMSNYVFEFAKKIAERTSEESIKRTKGLLNDMYGSSWEESLNMAIRANAGMRETVDFKKGLGSFLNKDKIAW